MASVASICNQALVSAGARSQINSIDDNTVTARTCKLFYDDTRDELLREAQWGFADKFVTLGLVAYLPGAPGYPSDTGSNANQVWLPTYPAPGWLFQYAYPDDCVKANFVIPQGSWGAWLAQAQQVGPWQAFQSLAVPFKLSSSNGKTVINTNAQQAIASYTERVTNPALYPPDFVTAFAGRLAFKLVIPLSGDKVLAGLANSKADDLVQKARANDGNEGLTIIDNIPDWLRARDWPDNYGGPPGAWLWGQ